MTKNPHQYQSKSPCLPLPQELIQRYEKRKKECFKNPNPYYRKGEFPTEYQDLKTKIKELKTNKILIL